jgi:zinc protease
MSQWGKADYYTDEQLADAKAILLRNHSRDWKNQASLAIAGKLSMVQYIA